MTATVAANRQRVLLSPPDVGDQEERLVVEAVRSRWIAPLGPMVDAFEARIAERCGRRHAVALSSGTAGLHLALLQAGAARGHAVIVPTLTFAATANAVVYTGAEPVFVDCDPHSGNMDPELLEHALTTLRRAGTPVAAVIAVDLLGRCADYSVIAPLCDRFGVDLVSDAAEALGSWHAGRPAGSFGVTAALSFNGNKIMTTSGGGMLLTDDAAIADRARYLSTQARLPAVHYEHVEIGYNYRLSNVLAALGLAQLNRLDGMIRRRRALREEYVRLFSAVPGAHVFQHPGDQADNCWLSAVVVDPREAGWSADELRGALDAADIESRPLWKPMHSQPVFAGARSFLHGSADRLFATGLALPSGSALGRDQIDVVMSVVTEFLGRHR